VRAVTREPLTEDALIAAIADAIGAPVRPLRVGIGDDAAAWQPKRHHLALLTTDMLIDGVHFRLESTPADSLGRKALAENLSDIAAMGGAPTVAVVGLGLTPAIDERWIREFYRGMSALASSSRCVIAGGDIVRAPALTVAITVAGEVRKTSMRLRSGARAGDVAAVTGPLGLAAAGLKLLDAGERDGAAVARYLSPEPRLAEGKFLGSRRAVHAMMDVSDGLSTDLARMAGASGVDAVVIRDQLFVHPALADARVDPIDAMLNGGDDYELLAAIDRRAFPFVARAFERRFGRPLCAVGRFEKGQGTLWLETRGERAPLQPLGYDHLSL
jgi:thiamine-monophosphate kinase